MKKININILLSLLFLTLGGAIYILTRPDSYISQVAERIISLDPLRSKLGFLNVDFLKYYFPDFLWSASFTCALFTINDKPKHVVLISGLTGILWEITQLIGLINGTGDFHDIIMYLTAIFVVVLINKKGVFKNEKEQH